MGNDGHYVDGVDLGPQYPPDVAEARFHAALKKMLGQPLTDEDWDALEAGPFDGDIVLKRPQQRTQNVNEP